MAARTEREIVLEATNLWFRHSEWSVEKFAHERLAPALAAADLVEPLAEPADGEEYLRSRKAWGQRLNRIFNGTAPFPLEWKQVWLDCLSPSPAAAVPARIGEVMEEVGQFIAAAKPSHNGRYDRNDDPAEVDRMLKEGVDAVFALINELTSVAAGTGRPLPALQLLLNQGKAVAND